MMDTRETSKPDEDGSEETDFYVFSRKAAKIADDITLTPESDGKKVSAEAWQGIFDAVYDRIVNKSIPMGRRFVVSSSKH